MAIAEVSNDQQRTRRGPHRRIEDHSKGPRLRDILKGLEKIVKSIQPFKMMFTQGPTDQHTISSASNRDRFNVLKDPTDFLNAWLGLIMALVFCSKDAPKWEQNIDKANDLLKEGMKKAVERFPGRDLLAKSVVQPFEVSLLVIFHLLQDIKPSTSQDILDTYSQYLNQLVRTFSKSTALVELIRSVGDKDPG